MKRIDKLSCLIIPSTLFGIWQLIFAQENAAWLDQYKRTRVTNYVTCALTKKFLKNTAKMSTLFEGETVKDFCFFQNSDKSENQKKKSVLEKKCFYRGKTQCLGSPVLARIHVHVRPNRRVQVRKILPEYFNVVIDFNVDLTLCVARIPFRIL